MSGSDSILSFVSSERHLRDLLEHLSLILRADGRRTAGLLPTHRALLRYLARANRYSDTPRAAAMYLGQTKGTVSQSLGLLERKGFVKKVPDPADRRVVRLHLTAKGRRAVGRDPDGAEAALTRLSAAEGAGAADALQLVLRSLQATTGGRPFGTCQTCRWFLREQSGMRCAATREALEEAETDLLCVKHEWEPDG